MHDCRERPVGSVSVTISQTSSSSERDGAVPAAARPSSSDTSPHILCLTLLEVCVCPLLGAVVEHESFTSPKTFGGSHLA